MRTVNMGLMRGEEGKTMMMKHSANILSSLFILICFHVLNAQDQVFLKRSVDSVSTVTSEISTETAYYKALFGAGDENSHIVKGIKRFGQLVIEPGGNSNPVTYEREEQIYYILEGTGILHYGNQEIPISKNIFRKNSAV